MRVLHLRSGTRLFGPERVILSLARHGSSDFEHIVGGVERGGPGLLLSEAERAGLQTLRLTPRRRLDLAAVRRLGEFVRSERIDVLHAHDFTANFYALAARRVARVATVSTLHLWNRNSLLTAAYEVLDALQVRLFDRVIAVSPAIAAEARRWRIPRGKIRVVLNGVDTERFAPVASRLPGQRHTIGSVGRLVRQKGYDRFLEMAAVIAAESPTVRFLLVGDGPERAALEHLAESLGLTKRVLFAGQRDPIESSYGELDVFVSSSLSEGLPIAVLEAMASRLPVVATRVGATGEVIEDGRSGMLVEPGSPQALADAVRTLLRDPARAQAMAAAGRRRVEEHFSARAMTEKTEAIYRELSDASR